MSTNPTIPIRLSYAATGQGAAGRHPTATLSTLAQIELELRAQLSEFNNSSPHNDDTYSDDVWMNDFVDPSVYEDCKSLPENHALIQRYPGSTLPREPTPSLTFAQSPLELSTRSSRESTPGEGPVSMGRQVEHTLEYTAGFGNVKLGDVKRMHDPLASSRAREVRTVSAPTLTLNDGLAILSYPYDGNGGLVARPEPKWYPSSIKESNDALMHSSGDNEYSPEEIAQLFPQPPQLADTICDTSGVGSNESLREELYEIVREATKTRLHSPLGSQQSVEALLMQIVDLYSTQTTTSGGDARSEPIEDSIYNVIAKAWKTEHSIDETKVRCIFNGIIELHSGLPFLLNEPETSMIDNGADNDSALGTSARSETSKKSTATTSSNRRRGRATKKQTIHTVPNTQAATLAPSRSPRPHHHLQRCSFVDVCERRRGGLLTKQQRRKHYLSHFSTKAVLCPHVLGKGKVCGVAFDWEHWTTNLKGHLENVHKWVGVSLGRDYGIHHRIEIHDRFHTTCIYCSEEFTNRISSMKHILKHWDNQKAADLKQMYVHRCVDSAVCGTQGHWEKSKDIIRKKSLMDEDARFPVLDYVGSHIVPDLIQNMDIGGSEYYSPSDNAASILQLTASQYPEMIDNALFVRNPYQWMSLADRSSLDSMELPWSPFASQGRMCQPAGETFARAEDEISNGFRDICLHDGEGGRASDDEGFSNDDTSDSNAGDSRSEIWSPTPG